MKRRRLHVVFVTLTVCMLLAASAWSADMTVTITNMTGGIYLTPLLITAHDAGARLFQLGTSASPQLQAMAEGGSLDGLLTFLGGSDADTIANPAGGLLGPGASTSAVLNTDSSGHTHLSLVAMLLPTNDGFVGLDALPIPTAPGQYTYYLYGYDAGTEANDELVTGGGDPGVAGIPADPGGAAGQNGSGVAQTETHPMVHIHPGNLGDLDPNGGPSDLDSRAHRWMNPVARLSLTVD